MKPVKQTRFGLSSAPVEERGNCYAACVASIFELSLSEVPDIPDDPDCGVMWDAFFKERGYYGITVPAGSFIPYGYTIATVRMPGIPGRTKTDYHAVVSENGIPVFDPADMGNDPAAFDILYYDLLIPRDPAKLQLVSEAKEVGADG